MPKQSLRNPTFRCNSCKEFHSSNDFPFLYQCAEHGYVCRRNHTDKNNSECDKQLLIYYWSKEHSLWIEVKEVTGKKVFEAGTIVDILIWGDAFTYESKEMKEYKREKIKKLICDTFQSDELDADGVILRQRVKVFKSGIDQDDAMVLVSKIINAGAKVFFARTESASPAKGKDEEKPASAEKADYTVIMLLLDSFEAGKLGKDEFISSLRKLLA